MKLAIVISNPEMGGAQRVSLNLAEWINRNSQYSVTIIALYHLEKNAYDMSNYNYHYVASKNKIYGLRHLLRILSIEIVLTMGVPLCIYTIPATIGLSVKNIVSERNDPTHFSGKWITKIISRFFMRFAHGYVFQTKEAKDFYNINDRKAVIIPNPLFNVNKMPAFPFNGIREKQIVTVGRLNVQKNHKLLIDTFAVLHDIYPDYKLIIWGEGNERNNLERYLKKLDLQDFVILPGTSNNIFSEIYKSSMFVLTSDFEGMPNALIEAMALGLPVVSTNCPCGGPSFLIQNNVNGILVEVGNQEELIESIKYVLNNPEQSNILGKQAFLIRELLSEHSINKRWLDFFEKINNQ